jgi:hypothetical protein
MRPASHRAAACEPAGIPARDLATHPADGGRS